MKRRPCISLYETKKCSISLIRAGSSSSIARTVGLLAAVSGTEPKSNGKECLREECETA